MAKERIEDAKSRMKWVLRLMKKHYPDSKCSLTYETPYQLLVATVLSAQCTDDRVNIVTPKLFVKYGAPEKTAKAKVEQIEEIVRSTGFYHSKAKAILSLSKDLVEKYGGQVPEELEKLIELRGVGRKTANVVLGVAFKKAEGVVVDTHVGRLARRMGFTKLKDAVKIEQDLMKLVPRKDWPLYSQLMIDHGRAVCPARGKPRCGECFVAARCDQIL